MKKKTSRYVRRISRYCLTCFVVVMLNQIKYRRAISPNISAVDFVYLPYSVRPYYVWRFSRPGIYED